MSHRLVESLHIQTALPSVVPSTSAPAYVSLKNYDHFTAIIAVKNATTVTGSAIALSQATAVAGTGAKALAFTKVWSNIDTTTLDAFAETAVTSNTFTTDATNSKSLLYVIEVEASALDVANGYDCIAVTTGNATAATVTVLYALSGCRYAGAVSSQPSSLSD